MIRPEQSRGEDSVVQIVICKLFWEIFECGKVPDDWKKSRVELIHKGGGKNKSDIGNYWPISIINILNKLFGIIINDKIKRCSEKTGVLGEEQNGFRKGRCGMEKIYILKEIIDRSKRDRKELYIAFLDIEKAYHAINREKQMKILRHIGLNRKMIDIIKEM